MEWLNKLIEGVFKWVPRIWLVATDEGGVRITLGKRVVSTPPGWYLYWPLIQEARKISVVTQVVRLPEQSLETVDGVPIVISGAIQYRISDAKKAIMDVEDYDDALIGLAMKIIIKYASGRTLEGCRDLGQLEAEVVAGTREIIGNWGLKIQRVYIIQLSRARVFRLLTDIQGRQDI